MRWKTKPPTPTPPYAPASWHALSDLYRCLRHVQAYIENAQSKYDLTALNTSLTSTSSRKRKSPDADPVPTRDLATNGLLTPWTERSLSPANVSDIKTEAINAADLGPRVYNAILQRKEGYLFAKKPADWKERDDIAKVNCRTLPTEAMIEVAKKTPVSQAESAIRHKFLHLLRPVKGVQLRNDVDSATPSLNFTFIDKYVLRNGIYEHPPESYEGCVTRCKPDMGQGVGCEYTAWCECLEYAAVDEERLSRKDPELYEKYQLDKLQDTSGLPKRFPYRKSNRNDTKRPQTLQPFYLKSRNAIYECNDNCRCGPVCKSRVVQKGRRVPLTIFKTRNRGWGVCCNEDLVEGEFIDTYLGEVITDEEANKREGTFGKEKNSYFYQLDKFVGDPLPGVGELTSEMCYIVDGQYMGNATRFINHSCEPNCHQYTVSYNKHDIRLYNLAFFASEDITAGTELTFDYQDEDEVEDEVAIQRREAAEQNPANQGRIRCNCGAPKCRGFLW